MQNEMERQRLDWMLSSVGEPLYYVAASEPAKQLIKHCLLPRDQRSTASELLSLTWLNAAETSRRGRRASADANQAIKFPEVDIGSKDPTLQPSSTPRPVSLPGTSLSTQQGPLDQQVWMKRGNISDDAVHQ